MLKHLLSFVIISLTKTEVSVFVLGLSVHAKQRWVHTPPLASV